MLGLRPRTTRPRYREYPPSEIPFCPAISSSNPFRILDLPLELIDRITSLLPPRTRLNLAYTCQTAYTLLVPLIYRIIDITSPNRLIAIFGSPTISQLVLIAQHTRAFHLSIALDDQAAQAVQQAAAFCPSGRLFDSYTTLMLSQKARYSIIDFPQYNIILKYFSSKLAIHVKWSGPCRNPHHFTSLFENFGQIASACRTTTFHLHLKMNEFLRMPPEAMATFRVTKPRVSTIRIYVHPNLRSGGKEPKEVDAVSQLGGPMSDLRNAFLEGRRADQKIWAAGDRSIRLMRRSACGRNISTAGHGVRMTMKPDPNRPMVNLDIIILNKSPEQVKELRTEIKRREVLSTTTVHDVDQADDCAGGVEAVFEMKSRWGKSGCVVCME